MTTIYYTAPYIPPEWIAAHGLVPRRLTVPSCGMELVRGVCPFTQAMQHAVCSACEQGYVVLGTHCDQMRRTGELLTRRADFDASRLFLFQMPATWKTEAARQHYRDELQRLSCFLRNIGGHVCPTVSPVACDGLKNVPVAGNRANKFDRTKSKRPRIALLAGDAIDSSPSLTDLIHQAGGQVILDATDRGERTRPNDLESASFPSDPLDALVRSYFDHIPDVYRRPNSQLYDWLERRMAEEQVQGLILHRYVWCDLWHAEAGRLKQWSRVPVLDLDSDGQWSGSLQTRLEAFLEMLR